MAKIRKINTHTTEESLSFETLFKEALEVDLFHYYSRQREHFKKSSKLAQQTHWNSIFCAYLEENFPGTTIDQYKTLYTRTNFKKCVDERTSIEVKAQAEKTKTLINNWYKPPETTFYSPMQVADMLVKVGHGPIQLHDVEKEIPSKSQEDYIYYRGNLINTKGVSSYRTGALIAYYLRKEINEATAIELGFTAASRGTQLNNKYHCKELKGPGSIEYAETRFMLKECIFENALKYLKRFHPEETTQIEKAEIEYNRKKGIE